jgi:hypothetical protein
MRWYLRYSLSLRDVEELLAERGLAADHTTIWRWVQRYGPELDQRLRRHLKPADQARRSCGRLIARKGSVTSADPVRARHSDRLIVPHSRMEPPHLPTENLAINCARWGGRWSSLVPSHNESSPQPGLIRCVRCISRGDKDSLAEESRFELSVDLMGRKVRRMVR